MIRVILSIMLSLDWKICLLNIKKKFLHGTLFMVVYYRQPRGSIDSTCLDHACLLNCSLYGLKQAPRGWN
jgi:hypothetical protein